MYRTTSKGSHTLKLPNVLGARAWACASRRDCSELQRMLQPVVGNFGAATIVAARFWKHKLRMMLLSIAISSYMLQLYWY